MMQFSGPAARHRTVAVKVGNVTVGGGAPVVVQSMTNTDTADVEATTKQVAALARAGSELVRITVDRDEAAAAVPHIKERLLRMNVDVPIVGDFHYIGHKLLADHPACAEALDKYRINPGNVGFKEKKDRQFGAIVETAIRHDKPVRIGANWGSLDQELLTHLMDENARSNHPVDARDVTREAMVQSALLSAERAEEIGLPRSKIIISGKVSAVQDLIAVYTELAERSNYALHLGLTEAGMGSKGIVASSAAMGFLLQQGIGDTIRVSLTPEPNGDRTLEVQSRAGAVADARAAYLRSAGCCLSRLRPHHLDDLSGTCLQHSKLHSRFHAGMEDAIPWRRGPQRRGDGLHRQRSGRKQTRRHRHFASRHRRGSRLRRSLSTARKAMTLRGPTVCGRLSETCRRLHRAAVRFRRGKNGGSGVSCSPKERHNMRRISSRMTFFYKWIFPVIWFGFLIVFVGIGVFGSQRSAPLPFLIVPLVMIGFGYFLMKSSSSTSSMRSGTTAKH